MCSNAQLALTLDLPTSPVLSVSRLVSVALMITTVSPALRTTFSQSKILVSRTALIDTSGSCLLKHVQSAWGGVILVWISLDV